MAKVCYLLITLLALFSAIGALNSLEPPDGESAKLRPKFGCSIASNGDQMIVFSLSTPFNDGSQAWKLYSYTKTNSSGGFTQSSTLAPDSPSSGSPSLTHPCTVAINRDHVVIGESWALEDHGRLTIATIGPDNVLSSPIVLTRGATKRDGLGADVELFDKWLLASAPGAFDPHVNIYKRDGSTFVFHSDLLGSQFNVEDRRFGTSIAIGSDWLAVGAPSLNFGGLVYVFRYVTMEDEWKLFQTLRPLGGEPGEPQHFGSVVALRNGHLFVSATGSSTEPGVVYEYRFGAHDEWQIFSTRTSDIPVPGDSYGRALAARHDALAITQDATNEAPYARVHVFRHCGSYMYSLKSIIVPDTLKQSDPNWGSSVAWNSDSLAIASYGYVDIWPLPTLTTCSRDLGAFPAPECCENGTSVLLSRTGTITTTDASEQFIDDPVLIQGNLQVLETSIIAVTKGASIRVDGQAHLNGKMKIRLPRPSVGTHAVHIDNIITYKSRRGTFQEFDIVFDGGEGKQLSCDVSLIQPVYGTSSLSVVLTITTHQNCKPMHASNPLTAVYVTLGILVVIIIAIVVLCWKFPQLRDMVTNTSRKSPGWGHSRMIDSDEEESSAFRSMSSFSAFGQSEDVLEERTGDADSDGSVGAEPLSDDDDRFEA